MSTAPNGSTPDGATVIIVDDSAVSLKVLERALLNLPGVEVKAFKRPEEPSMRFAGAMRSADHRLRDAADVGARAHTGMPSRGQWRGCADDGRHNLVRPRPTECSAEARRRGLPNEAHRCRRGEGAARNMVSLGRAHRKLADHSRWLTEEVTRATAGVVQRERETILRLSMPPNTATGRRASTFSGCRDFTTNRAGA